jgi:hypothetical protein
LVQSGRHRFRDQRGMNTTEYAVGTVAACGFAGALLLCGPWVEDFIRTMVGYALQEVLGWLPFVR